MDRYENLKGTIAILILILGVSAAIFYAFRGDDSKDGVATTTGQQVTVTGTEELYKCADGKTITALISEDSAHLVLSDGRELTVQRKGERFANDNDSFVFSGAGEAYIEEGGTSTYKNCVKAQ